jgi:hypothetical protein
MKAHQRANSKVKINALNVKLQSEDMVRRKSYALEGVKKNRIDLFTSMDIKPRNYNTFLPALPSRSPRSNHLDSTPIEKLRNPRYQDNVFSTPLAQYNPVYNSTIDPRAISRLSA